MLDSHGGPQSGLFILGLRQERISTHSCPARGQIQHSPPLNACERLNTAPTHPSTTLPTTPPHPQVAIDELPPGRQRVLTSVVPDLPEARSNMYAHMREEMAAGGQVYIICPLVQQSSVPGLDDLKAVTEERERLVADGIMREEDCGLLHGRLKRGWLPLALADM